MYVNQVNAFANIAAQNSAPLAYASTNNCIAAVGAPSPSFALADRTNVNVDQPSKKGKTGPTYDHAMHNACLDALIKHYKSVWVERFGVELRVVIVRTDNAPHQYRCRHAIMYVAMSDITIMHYLAVPSQFKRNP
jgi:hypothetical protein